MLILLIRTMWWTSDPSLLSMFPRCCLTTPMNIFLFPDAISAYWPEAFLLFVEKKREMDVIKTHWLWDVLARRGGELWVLVNPAFRVDGGGGNGFHILHFAYFMACDRIKCHQLGAAVVAELWHSPPSGLFLLWLGVFARLYICWWASSGIQPSCHPHQTLHMCD